MMMDIAQPADFDIWASDYDGSVLSRDGFPFLGYSRVLQAVMNLAAMRGGETVLDLGIGTGNLARLFSRYECKIWGLDFSEKMLEAARVKLPNAELDRVDIRKEWPPEFQRRYDRIVSAYTFHHFPADEKILLVRRLISENLSSEGKIIIGDIAFENAAVEDDFRQSLGTDWEQEYYWIVDEILSEFRKLNILVEFTKISACAGVFQFFLCNEPIKK
jgi:putative AdoMet-dependent methyltransferase